MLYHKQLNRHDPKNGIFGDCHRTAIACLLDLNPEDVPHFGEGFPEGNEFQRRVDEFLTSRGLHVFFIPYSGELDQILASIGHQNPDSLYLLGGKSTRGVNHTVVCRGGQVIHDPHPDGGGIVGPCDPDGFYWVEVLLPTQMKGGAA